MYRDIVNRVFKTRFKVCSSSLLSGAQPWRSTRTKEFFVELGSRITQRRKDSHLTQEQLAETLGSFAANNECACELGQRRVPVSAAPMLAKALGVGLEELLANCRWREETPAGTEATAAG